MNGKVTGLLLATTLPVIPGCGPDLQEEDEALKAEIETAREENLSLKEKFRTLENDKKTLTADVGALKTQVSDLENAQEAAKKAARPQSAPKRK